MRVDENEPRAAVFRRGLKSTKRLFNFSFGSRGHLAVVNLPEEATVTVTNSTKAVLPKVIQS